MSAGQVDAAHEVQIQRLTIHKGTIFDGDIRGAVLIVNEIKSQQKYSIWIAVA